MKAKELLRWWAVEWCPAKGGYGIHPLREVAERNMRQCMAEEKGGWILLGLFPTLGAAQEAERQVKRRKRETKEAEHGGESGEEAGGSEGGGVCGDGGQPAHD